MLKTNAIGSSLLSMCLVKTIGTAYVIAGGFTLSNLWLQTHFSWFLEHFSRNCVVMDSIWTDDSFKPFLRCTIFFQNRLLCINTSLPVSMVFLVHPCVLNSKFMLCLWLNIDYFDIWVHNATIFNVTKMWVGVGVFLYSWCFCSGITEGRRWVRSHHHSRKNFSFLK